MIVGCYSMELYCRNHMDKDMNASPYGEGCIAADRYGPRRKPWEFNGTTHADCKRQAKQMGFKFTKDKDVICPECVKAKVMYKHKEWKHD